jgi:hypothetical protein
MGRVNSLRRLAYAASIGCDSIDVTQWVRFRDTYLNQGLHACAAGAQLPRDLHVMTALGSSSTRDTSRPAGERDAGTGAGPQRHVAGATSRVGYGIRSGSEAR